MADDKTVSQENAAGAVQLTDLFRGLQNGLNVKFSFQQVKDFVNSFAAKTMILSGSVANGSASLILPIPAGYDVIDIDLTDFQVSANATISLTASINGGSVYLSAGYIYNLNVKLDAVGDIDNRATNDLAFPFTLGTVNGAHGISGSMKLMNPTSNIHHKRFFLRSLYNAILGNAMATSFGVLETISPITHIKIAPTAGTFVTGTYLVSAGKK